MTASAGQQQPLPQQQQQQQVAIAQHQVSSGREITYFNPATGKPMGTTTAGGEFFSVGSNQDLLFRTRDEAMQYASRQGQTGQFVGESNIPSSDYQRQAEAKAAYERAQYGVHDVRQPISAKILSEMGYLDTTTEKIVSGASPKPGQWGYHGTPERPGGIVQPITEPKPIEPTLNLYDRSAEINRQLGLGVLNAPKGKPIDVSGFPVIAVKPARPYIEPTKYTTQPLMDITKDISKMGEEYADKLFAPTGSMFTPLGAAKESARITTKAITSLPEFVATVPYGYEMIARDIYGGKGKEVPWKIITGAGLMALGLGTSIKEKPIETLGMMAIQGRVLGGIKIKVPDVIKFAGKEYVPPESIIEPQVLSGAERFPLAPRGTTGAEMVKEFKTSQFRIPGTEGKIGGWHATPEEFPKTTETIKGTSESPGLYIAPSTSAYFWKIGKEYKLFGFDRPPETPAGIWIGLKDITRAPRSIRNDIAAYNKFLTESAEKGKAYISSAFEKGIKPEKEAIIPPETPISRVSNKYYTIYEGKKVPLMEYSVEGIEKQASKQGYVSPMRRTEPRMRATIRGKLPEGSTMRLPTSRTMQSWGIGGTIVSIGGRTPTTKEQKTYGELAKEQARIEREYRSYKEPILSEKSILSARSSIAKSLKSDLSSLKKSSKKSSAISLVKSSSVSYPRTSEYSISPSKSEASGITELSRIAEPSVSMRELIKPSYTPTEYTPGKPGYPEPPTYPYPSLYREQTPYGKKKGRKSRYSRLLKLYSIGKPENILASMGMKQPKRKLKVKSNHRKKRKM